MSTSEYMDLVRDRDEQRRHVNALALELDDERRKLVGLERAIQDQHRRWLDEAVTNAARSS